MILSGTFTNLCDHNIQQIHSERKRQTTKKLEKLNHIKVFLIHVDSLKEQLLETVYFQYMRCRFLILLSCNPFSCNCSLELEHVLMGWSDMLGSNNSLYLCLWQKIGFMVKNTHVIYSKGHPIPYIF